MTIRPSIPSVPSSAVRHTMLIVCFVSRRISVSTSSASGSSLRSQVASLSRARTLSTLPISQEISIPARHPTRPSLDIRSLPVCINPVSEGGPKQRVDTYSGSCSSIYPRVLSAVENEDFGQLCPSQKTAMNIVFIIDFVNNCRTSVF